MFSSWWSTFVLFICRVFSSSRSSCHRNTPVFSEELLKRRNNRKMFAYFCMFFLFATNHSINERTFLLLFLPDCNSHLSNRKALLGIFHNTTACTVQRVHINSNESPVYHSPGEHKNHFLMLRLQDYRLLIDRFFLWLLFLLSWTSDPLFTSSLCHFYIGLYYLENTWISIHNCLNDSYGILGLTWPC